MAVLAAGLFIASTFFVIGHAVADLSCQGYRYGGIDWDHIRTTLEIYADKYLDRPQLLSDVLYLSSDYAVQYHPENKCVLGDLSLRFMMWLRLEEMQFRQMAQSLSKQEPPRNDMEAIVQETYEAFWNLDLTWEAILASGWPLFSVMAAAAGRLADKGRDACVPPDRLTRYEDSFDNAEYVPAHIDVATLVEAASCPEAVASASASLAAGLRLAVRPSEGNRYFKYTSTPLERQPSEDDASMLLARAESLLRRSPDKWAFMTTPWPLWRLLDRLGAREMVRVSEGNAFFWMHVFPHRVRSDGLISNRIRGTQKAYCLQLFQDEVRRSADSIITRPLRLVEVGPHIGDCMLWAAAAYGKRVRLLAVEPVPQVVSLFRKSIESNGFGSLIDLHHAFAGSKAGPPAEGKFVPWVSLDSLLAEGIDILKIHTNGGERGILAGASNIFAKHKVSVVIVHSAEPDELWGCAEFLLKLRRYVITSGGREFGLEDEAWLKEQVASKGGMQIHARERQ
eukprot:TRINITY_DN67339_c0_g1_i1.p1 TRINITY_DN67339_c0_g1~~TRINITY_DN67339_c0_g1_i1.p1  ORF type:complete len:529 (+),score=89.53 TRINITY_DN67339_c0_g1_i1:62-1588(+)